MSSKQGYFSSKNQIFRKNHSFHNESKMNKFNRKFIVPRIMIDLAVLKIHDFLLRKFDDFRRKFLLELNFCVVNSTGCFLPPKNQESSSLLKFQHFFMFIPVLPSKIEHFGVDH